MLFRKLLYVSLYFIFPILFYVVANIKKKKKKNGENGENGVNGVHRWPHPL